MSGEELTFNTLLLQVVNQGAAPKTFLEQSARQELLDKLKDVVEEPGKRKLFDRASLKHIASLFDEANEFYKNLQNDDHPARLVYDNPVDWFQQSYKFMYDPVAFLEVVRFFAGGKTQEEKEITFRALVSKLIKTQETVRTIEKNTEFLKRYLEKYPSLQDKYPSFLAKQNKLSAEISPEESVLKSLKDFVDTTSQSCLGLMAELDLELPAVAQNSVDSKAYYDALVLTIRHSPANLFVELGSDDYSILVEELTKVCRHSQLFPNIFLFQSAKREYLIDWLVYTLRQNDRDGADTFYQAGKAAVYSKFKSLSIAPLVLSELSQKENLDNQEVIDAEIASLNALTEDDLYALLLKMYTSYKNDNLVGQNMPLAPQSLSSSGDITWDKQNMVAQVNKKIKDLEATGGGAGKAQVSKFTSMLGSIKKASKIFSVASKKVEEKKKQTVITQKAEPSEPSEKSVAPAEPPSPPMEVKHTGIPIEPCFPLPKRDCPTPVPGQKQDISFNNSDNQAGIAPAEQDCIVNMFNLENEPNQPKINKNYFKMSSAIGMILSAYGDKVERLQKKYVSGVSVDSFIEEVLYLRIKEDVVLVLGVTQMGQAKGLGSLPKKQTTYFRLFVKGDLAKGLSKYKVPSVLKEFKVDDRNLQFKEIAMPTHYKKAPEYQGVLVDALATVIEGLKQEVFDILNDDKQMGFVSILQQKAKHLIDQQGVTMTRTS